MNAYTTIGLITALVFFGLWSLIRKYFQHKHFWAYFTLMIVTWIFAVTIVIKMS